MKKIDYNAPDRAGWEKLGKSLSDAPPQMWLNIGQWLNAGDRFFAGSKGCDEKMLIGTARQLITTVDERSLRRYRETERKTRDARGKMADNGCPLDKNFIYFYHVRGLKSDDQFLFLTTKRLWPSHLVFREVIDGFSVAIKENLQADHNEVLDNVYGAVELELKNKPPRATVDKSMKNVTVSVTKENYAILEWLAGKDETTVADLLSDAAYNLAQDNLTDYREHEKEHKIASIKAEIESVEAKKNDQSVTAEILKKTGGKSVYGVLRSTLDRTSMNLDSKLSKLRGELAELEALGCTTANLTEVPNGEPVCEQKTA